MRRRPNLLWPCLGALALVVAVRALGPGLGPRIGAAAPPKDAGGAASTTTAPPAVPGAPAAPSGDACILYIEDFDAFGDPRDLDDGSMRVRWCTNGAQIVGSGFCPTGGALRLDGATEDPRIVVELGGSACATVELSFDYAQFVDTQSRVRGWASVDPAPECPDPAAGTWIPLTATGGACTPMTVVVSGGGAGSVVFQLDHGANANALLIDNLVIRVSGCCGAHPCCETGTPGCADASIAACVCALDPFCCEVAWDATCVAEVIALGCGDCAPAPGDCVAALATDFGDAFVPGGVCANLPAIFESCEGVGPYLTTSGGCAGPGDAAMRFGEGIPYSAAITRCLDFSTATAPALSFTWSKDTGTLGPAVAVSLDGGAFQTVWTAPIVAAAGCHEVALDLAELAGLTNVRLRFASGSSVTNGARIDDVTVHPDGLAHDCCTAGGPGCTDAAVSACVCEVDPYCCETAWDDLCVVEAEYFGCADCDLCADALASDFGAAALPGDACTALPDLLAACGGAGPFVSTGSACGGADDAALVFADGAEPSSTILKCLDLAGATTATLAFRYAKAAGTLGPVVEASLDFGATWETAWIAPPAATTACRAGCADLSPWAGLSLIFVRLRAGDALAGGQAFDDLQLQLDASCPPSADLDGDGVVDFADLLVLLSHWGMCPPIGACGADLDGNGRVDFADLLLVLAAFGS